MSRLSWKKFRDEVLSVKYKNQSINDVLNGTAENLIEVFSDVKSIRDVLQCLIDIGLEYLELGRMSMNLSGGESQRIKLTN